MEPVSSPHPFQPEEIGNTKLGSLFVWILLVGLWALGAWLRLRQVEPALLFGDELHSLRDMQGGYLHILSHFSETGSGLALPLLQKAFIDLFGDGHWSLRAPAWIPGLLLLFSAYPLVRRRFGQEVGVLLTAWIAVEPLLVFYAHFGRIYSAVALLSLCLLMQLEWILERDRVHFRRLFTLAVCTAILPWAHLTALGFILPVYLAAFLTAATAEGRSPAQRRRRVIQLVAALCLGGLFCVLLYLPAYASLWNFVRIKTDVSYYGDFGLLDILTLVAGNRSAAWVLLLLAGAGTGFWLQKMRWSGAVLSLAVLGPLLTLALTRPYGDAYAYARYILPSVAPLGILLALAVKESLRALGARSPGLPLTLGLVLALLLWQTGPLALGAQSSVPQHANTYLSLLKLPAFDAPWPETPQIYRDLAEQTRDGRVENLKIVEWPALNNRARHLYRHYQIQHGAETILAVLPGEFPRLPSGPYASPLQEKWLHGRSADYLIVHIDVHREAAQYWAWVYGPNGPGPFGTAEVAHMERHERYGGPLPAVSLEQRKQLARALGPPIYRDAFVEVWKLDPDLRD